MTAGVESESRDLYANLRNFKTHQVPYRIFDNNDQARLPCNLASPNFRHSTQRLSATMLHEISTALASVPAGLWNSDTSIVELAQAGMQIIIREWLLYMLFMGRCVKLYEPSLSVISEGVVDKKTHIVIADLFRWRRRARQSLVKLQAMRCLIQHPPNRCELSDALVADIQFVSSQIGQFQAMLEPMVPILASTIQLTDSRRALCEAIYIKRLTYIALIFLPLSFVSSVLSISEQFAVNSGRFWIYLSTAILLLIIVLAISHFAPFRGLLPK
ncbi:hypothetical protein F5X97DRAFT_319116 [Nemania serpens]|nr:hypothetical protein F5X97DRAFT_319116 [Nemania serpens]